MNAERVCRQKCELVMERTVLFSHPSAVPTKRPRAWSADCGRPDEFSTGRLNRIEIDCKQPWAYTAQA
ncbi:MAG: hypothetical protein ACYCV0_19715 [Desulfitobacteriaceae bacterium]